MQTPRAIGRVAGLLVATATVAACGGAPAVEHQIPFTAAVVRGDGYLVPFASYADGTWSGPPIQAGSPYGDRPTLSDRAEPWFVPAAPAGSEWQVAVPVAWDLPATGAPPRTMNASTSGEPASVMSHCSSVWALESNLDATPSPPGTVHAITGAAFSPAITTAAVAELSVDPALTDGAHAVLRAAFDAAEAAESARRAGDDAYEPRQVGADAATSPLAFTRLYRVASHDQHEVYLFEAQRTYPQTSSIPEACDQATVMTGWLVESPSGEFTIISSDLTMTDCSRKGSPLLRPLVTVSADGRLYAIVVARHYESESYHVFEVAHDAVREVLDVDAGGC